MQTKQQLQPIAGKVLFTLFAASIVFHLLVISGIIDFRMVWGGRLKNPAEMYLFEAVSLLINALFLWTVAQHMHYIRRFFPVGLIRTLLWIMTGIFLLNTLGNLVSLNRLEVLLFTPVTAISAVCCAILAARKMAH